MFRKLICSISFLGVACLGAIVANAQSTNEMQQKVGYLQPSYFPLVFPLDNQIGGYVGNRYKMNLENRLLKVDEEGLLDGFMNRPGKHRWIGEHIGKYLEAAANTWEITKDDRLKTQMDRMFQRLIATQKPDGYLGTYAPENYWTSWDVWSHKYDLYGLLAYYRVTGNVQALTASVKIGDLICKTFGDGIGQRNILKSGSHVGMAATSILDPMLDLYMWTGDKKYLDFGKYIIRSYNFEGGPAIVRTLLAEKRVDKVANGKAYEMLSNIVGLVKMYRLTNDPDLYKIINYAFDDITTHRLFVTGTTSDHERFKDNDYLLADTSAHMGEGCVTTTWIQFNMQMFAMTGQMKYYNEIEKSYYNHLLGAENPQSGCVSYYTPLIGEKPYACHITCCLSSVPRGIALLPYLNYGKWQNKPTVLMYESAQIQDSILSKGGKKIKLNMDMKSSFPEKGKAQLKISVSNPTTFTLQLRNPIWANNFVAKVNGRTYRSESNQFVKIEKLWKDGDVIDISFDIKVEKLEGGSTYPGYFTLKRGPQVLAVDASLNKAINTKTDKFSLSSKIGLVDVSNKLQKIWIGQQLYTLPVTDGNGKKELIYLTPYADASQTGGYTDLWIKGFTSR